MIHLMGDQDPVVEAYKQGVDRTLLRANLELTVEEARGRPTTTRVTGLDRRF